MKPFEAESVLRRWGFYANHRLAYAGIAFLSGSNELCLRFIETEHHAHSATLPERIRLEQLIRDLVGAETAQSMGQVRIASFRFEPYRMNENQLADQIFGASHPESLPDN